MRYLATLIALPVLLLVGCGEDPRINPLTEWDQLRIMTLADWLYENNALPADQMADCGDFWANTAGTAISPDDRTDCNALAENIAAEMTAAGYGDIEGPDLHLPAIWQAYTSVHRRRSSTFTPDYCVYDCD